MKVLITGSQGYIGSVLCPKLLSLGVDVVGLDIGYFREACIYRAPGDTPRTLCMDIRDVRAHTLKDFDAIIHLGELCNEPLCGISPEVAADINYSGTAHLGACASNARVPLFIYMSSVSVYGESYSDTVSETTPVNPKGVYALNKVKAEEELLSWDDEDTSFVVFRNSNVFGPSPAMRFDIVLNNLTGMAHTQHKILTTSNGTPSRPMISINDVCETLIQTLYTDYSKVAGQIFNLGGNSWNYTVKAMVELTAQAFGVTDITYGNNPDIKPYNVCFDKLHSVFPRLNWTSGLGEGILDLKRWYDRIGLDEPTFSTRKYTRKAQVLHLLKTGQLTPKFTFTPCETTQEC